MEESQSLVEILEKSVNELQEKSLVKTNHSCRECKEIARYKLMDKNKARYECAFHFGVRLGKSYFVCAAVLPILGLSGLIMKSGLVKAST
jgi:hypothetical protein